MRCTKTAEERLFYIRLAIDEMKLFKHNDFIVWFVVKKLLDNIFTFV